MLPGRSTTLWLLILVAVLSACAAGGTTAVPGSDLPGPTPTAFVPEPPTATPAVVRLWLSPAVPPALRQTVAAAVEQPQSGALLVDLPGSADVRFEPGGDSVLAEWVYALAAPFPTIDDGVTLDELDGLWQAGPILVADDTLEALRAALGEPGAGAVRLLERQALVETAWQERSSLAIVPFEDLEPRWKVLEVGGSSPIRREFETSGYPLRVAFGLSGPPSAVELLQGLLAQAATSNGLIRNREPDRLTTVVMTGVTALARATEWRMVARGVSYPGLLIGDWLRQADLTHTSNEVSFSEDCPEPDPGQESLRFCSQPANLALLEEVGIDVIELTGNHLLDWGTQAFLNTLTLYRRRGLEYFGGGEDEADALQPYRVVHNGNRLAFLGCNAAGPEGDWARTDRPGAARCSPEWIASTVAALRADGYLPIFTFQWPESYRPEPLPDQVDGFRSAALAGALIVSGSQAHRPQGFEFYQGALIHYGLGNLFFDQMWSVPTRQELIDRHVFYDGRHLSTEVLTAFLEDYAQPRPMTADERAGLLQEMFAASGW